MQDEGQTAVVGATRRYGFTPEQSLAELGREVNSTPHPRDYVNDDRCIPGGRWTYCKFAVNGQ
eukprot:scaffold1203_cov18-Prasinocladus_malaysianus.AAC.1